MTSFRFAQLGFVLGLSAAVSASAAEGVPADRGLTVHEWGTFTSVAGADGAPVTWTVLAGPGDLPCFVNRLGPVAIKAGPATVRMETPVLYFYSPSRTTVSVHVDFPKGLVTEWYPKATGQVFSGIDWSNLTIIPGGAANLPSTPAASHYYAARETDAAIVDTGSQQEKMLFYRGAGRPDVLLQPRFLPDGRLELRNLGSEAIPFAMVFDNRGGKTGYRIVRSIEQSAAVELPERAAAPEALRGELAAALTEAGLFPKEAQAMLATWRDSWFEEGTRIFYILPRAAVDRALPLRVSPAPQSIARVFVGRVEVLAPATRESLQTAIESGDVATLGKYGRFVDAYMHQLNRSHLSAAAAKFLDSAYNRAQEEFQHPSCR
jgi:hypothetical protein